MLIIDGQLLKEENIKLDSGFYFGRGVFETILVKKQPIFLKEHIERMTKGLRILNIDKLIGEKYILNIMENYNIKNCVLKIVATEKNIVIITTREVPYKLEDYIRGFKLKLSNIKRNPYSHTVYLKSLNYTDNILEKEKAIKEGYDEVLFLNTKEELAEGSASNIFFVRDKKIYTPSIECGILNGVVRNWVIENFEVFQGKYSLQELLQAEEIFITNSIMGIMKVKSIDTNEFEHGNLIDSISNKYKEFLIKLDKK